MKERVARFLPQEIVILSVIIALVAANSSLSHDYHALIDYTWFVLPEFFGGHHVNLHWFVNEGPLMMTIFFLVAGAEVRASLLKGGPLHGIRKAALPMLAVAGGVIGPRLNYGFSSDAFAPELAKGWVIVAATDIVFALLVGRYIFGAISAALTFLLTLAVVDDGVTLGLIPSVYSDGIDLLQLIGLLILVSVIVLALRAFNVTNWRWYVGIAGTVSWLGFLHIGIEAAMGFVPIVAFMPHAQTDSGWFRKEDLARHDTLNTMEHDLKPWLGAILFAFGLVNAGVKLDSFGDATVLVASSLVIGKLVGITLFTLVGIFVFKLSLPGDMKLKEVPVVAATAGIGFTVSVFVSGIAFSDEAVSGAAKIGALASLPLAAFVAIALARVLKVGRWSDDWSGKTSKSQEVDLAST